MKNLEGSNCGLFEGTVPRIFLDGLRKKWKISIRSAGLHFEI
jgi:hypothetical protein